MHPLMENFVTIDLEYIYNINFLDDIDALLYLKQGSHLCSSK